MQLVLKQALDPFTHLGVGVVDSFSKQTLHRYRNGKGSVNGKNQRKKIQSYGAQLLIRQILNLKTIQLQYDECGKPFLVSPKSFLSISHSHDYIGVCVSKRFDVGLDLEKIRERIHPIAERFMRDQELKHLSPEHKTAHLTTYWCAKEALYKLYGKKKLRLKENLLIKPFSFRNKGRIRGTIQKNNFKQSYYVHYKQIGDYILTYVKGLQ